ncbi:hypothetical protein AB0A77_17370 [Streptomyces varsoviensis]|uniref:hypothetical protein n=1 Tax=Streptomyces varsoviensis TaxID=67373 RepID=UPI0033EAF3D7
MRTLFRYEVFVHYGQIYVESDPEGSISGMPEAFEGQESGLCGAAVPGSLFLTTGLHTGHVGFTVELHESEPALDDSWEEVVETSFRPLASTVELMQWAGEARWDLDLEEVDYRVRYCAVGMEEAQKLETILADEPQIVDRYLLQFWPSPPRPARVVRQTTAIAAHSHEYARKLPPPPTPEERAEAERVAQQEAERKRSEAEKAAWGGRLPSEALRQVGGNVQGLMRFDAGLVHAIDGAGADRQRVVARLAARRAYDVTGLAELDWVVPALAALDEGRPLPAPFDDRERVWELVDSDERVPARLIERATPPGLKGLESSSSSRGVQYLIGPLRERAIAATRASAAPAPIRMSQSHMAVPALFAAAGPDPLQAALDAVYAAVTAYGAGHPDLLREVWAAVRG